jgi:hypothetical protein
MMARIKDLVKCSNQIYDFELKYLEINITRSNTLYLFPKIFYLWTRCYNLNIYNVNKNGKNCGRKDIWCAKSEVIFSTLNAYCMKLRGPGQKLLLISKDISFIIKMAWSLFWLFQKKSSKPWPEKTLVWLIWYQIYDFECVLLEIVGSWWNCFYWFSKTIYL